jgi:DNA-binding MarR family transcriptional regulator
MEFEKAQEIVRAMRRLTIHQRGRKTELLRKYGLQAGQDAVLLELANLKTASQNELAQAVEVDDPSVGRSIQRLEAKGFVKRTVDRRDARRRVVELTPAGRKLIPKIKNVYVKMAHEAVDGLSDGTQRRLVKLLNETADRLA